jgi:dephospho-CoA kinase
MRLVGLTGGIASGKSLVSSMFRSLGATVLSADDAAREVVVPGSEAFQEIVQAFGPEMARPDGTLDRKRLGDLIFRDASARARLNAITHPRIHRILKTQVDRLRGTSSPAVVIVEIPLLLDTASRSYLSLDGVIVVSVDKQTQIARLMSRERLSREAAEARLNAQRPLAEKVAEADWIIDNSGSIEQTRQQVEALWNGLQKSS